MPYPATPVTAVAPPLKRHSWWDSTALRIGGWKQLDAFADAIRRVRHAFHAPLPGGDLLRHGALVQAAGLQLGEGTEAIEVMDTLRVGCGIGHEMS